MKTDQTFKSMMLLLAMIGSQSVLFIPPTFANDYPNQSLPIENFKCQNPFLHGELQQQEFNLVRIINDINLQYQNSLTTLGKIETEAREFSKQIDEIADMATWLVSNKDKLNKFRDTGIVDLSMLIEKLDLIPVTINLHPKLFTGETSNEVSLELRKRKEYLQTILEKLAGLDLLLETATPSTLANYFTGFSSTIGDVNENSAYILVNLSDHWMQKLREIRSECESLSSGMSPNIMIRVATVDITPNPNCLYGYSLGGYFYDLQNGQTRRSSYSARDKDPTNCGFYFGGQNINIVGVRVLDNFTYQTLYRMNNSLHSLTMYNYIIYKYERLENNQCSEVTIAKNWQKTDSNIGGQNYSLEANLESQSYSLTVGNWSTGWSSPVICSGASCTLNKIKSIPLPQVDQYSTITECPPVMN
jgi:hypothetical protein